MRAPGATGIAVVVSPHVAAPISWGVFRPIIVLDEQTAARDAQAILDHELAHIARRDWPMLLLAQLVCALFWINPLAWWLRRELSLATEAAADDFALRRGSTPADYAQELLALATPSRNRLAATAAASSVTELRTRVVSILDATRDRSAVTRMTTVIASVVAMSVTLLVAGATSTTDTETTIRALEQLRGPHFASLARAMRERNYEHRRGSESGLFSDPAAVAPLTAALRDRDPVIRRLAAWGLSEMRIRETAPPLVPLLRDPDPLVRGEAARALGDLGHRDAVDDIIELLDDPDAGVRSQALHALGDLRDPRALHAVQRVVETESDPAAAQKARWALHELE